MLRLVLTLTGLALLSQAHHAMAQTGAVKNTGLDQFFSSVLRSSPSLSGVGDDSGTNVGSGVGSRKASHIDLSHSDPPLNDPSHRDLFRSSCEKIIKEDLQTTSLIDMKIDRVIHRSGKMKLQLRSVYTQGPALYFLLRVQNRSSLDYDVEAIHFFIADPSNKKTPLVSDTLVRSPLVRSKELKPVYVYDSSSVVPGYGQAANVVVLPRFTLPYGKRLVIEVLEKNGGRQLQLQTNNYMLERARIL
ncbi:MAG TPA: DUF4138 domain-containing protein [Puia sp.]|nr:DUF4138 domain-containing protein [Puia sp.]